MLALNRHRQRWRHGRGLTLVELMVVLAIAVLLVRLAAPSYRGLVLNQRLGTAASDFLSSLLQARSEALRLGRPVLVVPRQEVEGPPAARHSWLDGWCLFVDHSNTGMYGGRGSLIACSAPTALAGSVAVVGGSGRTSGTLALPRPYVAYGPLGFTKTYPSRDASATLPNGTLWLRADTGGDGVARERAIIVSRSGRARLCDPQAGSGPTPCSTD